MDDLTFRIFQFEIATHCRFILAGATELSAISNEDLVPGMGLTDPYWRPVQTILVSAANLSKIFWGGNAATADRRKPLRRSLKVTQRSPLYNREVRNQFEHFDDKLEKWAKRTNGNYVGRNVESAKDPPVRKADRFAHLDPSTGEVTFFGHSILLGRVIQEAARLRPLSEAAALGMNRSHRP